jgi:hypothetical protein
VPGGCGIVLLNAPLDSFKVVRGIRRPSEIALRAKHPLNARVHLRLFENFTLIQGIKAFTKAARKRVSFGGGVVDLCFRFW